jgi:hypothetical protein
VMGPGDERRDDNDGWGRVEHDSQPAMSAIDTEVGTRNTAAFISTSWPNRSRTASPNALCSALSVFIVLQA